MTKSATKKPPTAAKPHLVDLERLTQAEIAKLTGKPSVFFRDNCHLDGCHLDGTYHGPRIVRALRGEFQPVELPDGLLEPVRQVCERLTFGLVRPDLALASLEAIERIHGAAGLAAIGQQLLDEIRQSQLLEQTSPQPAPTPSEIRASLLADAERAAEQQIKDLADWDAVEYGRLVVQCERCDCYRWGRSWRLPPIPVGYARAGYVGICPPCEKDRDKSGR